MIAGAALALAMQLMPGPALPRWRVIGRNAQGEIAIDPASIVRQGRRIRVYARLRPRVAQGGMAVGVTRYVYDCGASTVRSEASDFYNPRGGFVGTLQARPYELRDVRIVPGSLNALAVRQLCAPGRR
jgi:hypothetical protein